MLVLALLTLTKKVLLVKLLKQFFSCRVFLQKRGEHQLPVNGSVFVLFHHLVCEAGFSYLAVHDLCSAFHDGVTVGFDQAWF